MDHNADNSGDSCVPDNKQRKMMDPCTLGNCVFCLQSLYTKFPEKHAKSSKVATSQLSPCCQSCAVKVQEVEKCRKAVKSNLEILKKTARDSKRGGQYSWRLAQFERHLKSTNVDQDEITFTLSYPNEFGGSPTKEYSGSDELIIEELDDLEQYSKLLTIWRCVSKCGRQPWRNRCLSGIIFCVLIVTMLYATMTGVNKICSIDEPKLVYNDDHVTSWDLFIDTYKAVDPCDDFFQFACQDWHRNYPRQEDKNYWSTFTVFNEETAKIMISMLEEPIHPESIDAYKQAQMFYKSCLHFLSEYHEDNIDTATLKTLQMFWNFTDTYYEISSSESETDKSTEQTFCEYYTSQIFELPLAQKYFTRMYKNSSNIEEVINEVNLMTKHFKEYLQEFMRPFERYPESSKMDEILICTAFPSWLFNDTRVQQEYDKLDVNQSTFQNQFVNAAFWLLKGKVIMEQELLANTTGLTECKWRKRLAGLGSYFDVDRFHIYLVMGHIHYFLSEFGHDPAAKYGTLGSVIGHEISHAFYTIFENTTKENNPLTPFKECLVKQYNSFTVDQLQEKIFFLDGDKTLKENFADNVGLRMAYNAYKKVIRSVNVTPEKNDFVKKTNYTDEQTFFLKFAQSKCSGFTRSGIQDFMEEHTHSPNLFRVFGPLQNSEEFAKAWNCPVGSKMNPDPKLQAKCSI